MGPRPGLELGPRPGLELGPRPGLELGPQPGLEFGPRPGFEPEVKRENGLTEEIPGEKKWNDEMPTLHYWANLIHICVHKKNTTYQMKLSFSLCHPASGC